MPAAGVLGPVPSMLLTHSTTFAKSLSPPKLAEPQFPQPARPAWCQAAIGIFSLLPPSMSPIHLKCDAQWLTWPRVSPGFIPRAGYTMQLHSLTSKN